MKIGTNKRPEGGEGDKAREVYFYCKFHKQRLLIVLQHTTLNIKGTEHKQTAQRIGMKIQKKN